MRGAELDDFVHLREYARLLNQAVRRYAREDATNYQGTCYRVMSLTEEKLKQYCHDSDPRMNVLSWDGFTSATKSPDKAMKNLGTYADKDGEETVLFIIQPSSDKSKSIFPADLSQKVGNKMMEGYIRTEMDHFRGCHLCRRPSCLE